MRRIYLRHKQKVRLVVVFALISVGIFSAMTLLYTTGMKTASLTAGYDIKLRTPPNHTLFSSWIVITTVAPPTADVMHMASLPGWRVVVVGDEKTPVGWSYPNCVYLSVADQKALGFRLTSKLPVRSYTRKNIGYLYAILHGATVIYDTVDDSRPLDNLTSFHAGPSTAGLVVDDPGGQVVNPYPHFGQPTLWPRGFPLAAINGQKPIRTYRLSTDLATPLIQQGLVQGHSDFDAIFRLTRKGTANVFNVTFDPVSPPVFLPTRMFSPINSQNTLFLKKAFWALLLPTTTAFRVCDIWRGYWAQRLLWEVGGSLGFPGANARQPRNVQSYLSDALEETQMYFQTDRLLEFLTSWSCPQHLSFFACVENLSFGMATEGFWGKEDAEVAKIWLEDLLRAGYQEPQRVISTLHLCKIDHSKSRLNASNDCEESHVTAFGNGKDPNSVVFSPVDQEAPYTNKPINSNTICSTQHVNQVVNLCPKVSLNNPADTNQPSKLKDMFKDVLLIITFNHPYYKNLRYLEAAYRPSFHNIAYCGIEAQTFRNSSQGLGRDVTFIEAEVDSGKIGYICLLKAISAGFRVAGYLILGDDVLLNFWAFSGFNKSRIWATDVAPVETRFDGKEEWPWWRRSRVNSSWAKAHSELSKTKVPAGITSPSACSQTIRNNIRALGIKTNESLVIHGLADIYYVPARFVSDVNWYLTFYLKHKLFLEIAVPVVLYGLQSHQDMEHIKGSFLWYGERNDPWTFFNPRLHYLHPVKFSAKRSQRGFCSHYAPLLVTHT